MNLLDAAAVLARNRHLDRENDVGRFVTTTTLVGAGMA